MPKETSTLDLERLVYDDWSKAFRSSINQIEAAFFYVMLDRDRKTLRNLGRPPRPTRRSRWLAEVGRL